MAVVRRTLLGRTISHLCTGHPCSLDGLYPLKTRFSTGSILGKHREKPAHCFMKNVFVLQFKPLVLGFGILIEDHIWMEISHRIPCCRNGDTARRPGRCQPVYSRCFPPRITACKSEPLPLRAGSYNHINNNGKKIFNQLATA